MAIEIKVPELGESVVEATIVKWFKSEGDPVKIGEALVELETEKANFEVAAEKQGVLSKILKQDGEDVEVGEVLGSIEEGKAGDAAPAKEEAKAPEPAPEPEPVKEAPKQETEERVTPVAKRVAEENNVDVSKVQGTGPSGRVTKEDVEAYIAKESPQPAKEEPAKSPSTAEPASGPAIAEKGAASSPATPLQAIARKPSIAWAPTRIGNGAKRRTTTTFSGVRTK